jgi:hypothetical protein
MTSQRRAIIRDDYETVQIVLMALYAHALGTAKEPLHETLAFLFDEYAANEPPVPRGLLADDEAVNRVVAHALAVVEALARGQSEIGRGEVMSVPSQCAARGCEALTVAGFCSRHQCQRHPTTRRMTNCSRLRL